MRLFNIFKKNKNEKYIYELIPFQKIGPLSLYDTDKSNFNVEGVNFLYKNAFNHVLCRPNHIDHPDTIRRGLNNKELTITINGRSVKINCYYEQVLESLKEIDNDIIEYDDNIGDGTASKIAYCKNLGMIISSIKDEDLFFIYSITFLGKNEFEEAVSLLTNKIPKEKIIIQYKNNTYYYDFVIDNEYEFEGIKFVVTPSQLWIDKAEDEYELGVSSSRIRTLASYKNGHLNVCVFEEANYNSGYFIEESPIIYKYNGDYIKITFK